MTKNCVMCRVNADLEKDREYSAKKFGVFVLVILSVLFVATGSVALYQMGVQDSLKLIQAQEIKK